MKDNGRIILALVDGKVRGEVEIRSIPGFLSILPPMLAIGLALLFRQVIISLVAGIYLGAIFLFDYSPVAGF